MCALYANIVHVHAYVCVCVCVGLQSENKAKPLSKKPQQSTLILGCTFTNKQSINHEMTKLSIRLRNHVTLPYIIVYTCTLQHVNIMNNTLIHTDITCKTVVPYLCIKQKICKIPVNHSKTLSCITFFFSLFFFIIITGGVGWRRFEVMSFLILKLKQLYYLIVMYVLVIC